MLISEKLKAIRTAEGLSQSEFCKIIGIPISTLKKLEGNHNEPGWSTIQIITQHPQFEKYTLWLINNKVAVENGQISPFISAREVFELAKKRNESTTTEISSYKSNLQSIVDNISSLDDHDLNKLAKVLSRRGALFLLELFESNNQELLCLRGIKKQAAWMLKNMDDEKVREILSEVDKVSMESRAIEEVNSFIQKSA